MSYKLCCALHNCIAPPHAALDAMRRSIPSATYHCRNNPNYVQHACRYSVCVLCAGAMIHVYSLILHAFTKRTRYANQCILGDVYLRPNLSRRTQEAIMMLNFNKQHLSYTAPSCTTSSVLTVVNVQQGRDSRLAKQVNSHWPTCAL